MKNTITLLIAGLVCVLINSCSTSQQTSAEKRLRLSVQAGTNIGGITENTDMTVVPGAESTVDAFSGATNKGFNAGAHINKPLKYNQVETGIDYMYNQQTFAYNDVVNNYAGVRELNVSQLMIPLTYNFVLFRKLFPNADIQIKLGYTGQLNFISVSSKGNVPEYSINPWSNGGTFGISAFPFQFRNGSKVGVYFDGLPRNPGLHGFLQSIRFRNAGFKFYKIRIEIPV